MPQTHFQNCPFSFDYHHQNLIHEYKAPPQPTSPTASQSTQPFCKDAECGPTDRQTDCSALWCCRNVGEDLHTITVPFSVLPCIAAPCRTLRNVVEWLWTIVVPCGALECISRNVAEGLQTIVELCGARGANSTPCNEVHHILSPHNSSTLRKRYRKLTDHGNACGQLWCVAVDYSALRKRSGSLADHWNASKPLWFTTTHCGASSARCGRVHHTFMETPKIPSTSPIIWLIHKSP